LGTETRGSSFLAFGVPSGGVSSDCLGVSLMRTVYTRHPNERRVIRKPQARTAVRIACGKMDR
jgi:hypothetical protein